MRHLISFCNEQIKIQEDSIRGYRRWIAALFVAATIVMGLGLREEREKSGVELIKFGAAIAAIALAAVPYKEIPPRRSQILTLKLLRQNLTGIESMPAEERTRVMGLVEHLIKAKM
jgi:hypothetical protein